MVIFLEVIEKQCVKDRCYALDRKKIELAMSSSAEFLLNAYILTL